MRLTEKVRVIPQSEAVDPEDILSESLYTLFTDDLRNEHGDPGAVVVYKSRDFGDVNLRIANPATEDDRRLFAHYLWNASIFAAEAVQGETIGVETEKESDMAHWEGWNVKGETVLELGAGLGLVGIISAHCGASKVVISDYPTPELLANISTNVNANVPSRLRTDMIVTGHKWGEVNDDLSRENAASFTRIFAADCLWMPGEHRNLAQSMRYFLSLEAHARAYVVAGFHTGRAKLAPFFEVVVEEGFDIEAIREIDVLEGRERAWARERDGGRENVTERKRWLVVAVLKLKNVKAKNDADEATAVRRTEP